MSAENKLGASEYSEVVQVTTLEEVPSGPPLAVRAEAKSSTEISVMWDAPERDHWNGILLGYYVGYQMSLTPEDKEVNPTQGFSFKTVEVRSHFGGETVLANLNKFTQYHVIVQAYTSQGSGPPSKEIAVQTMEDGKWAWPASQPGSCLFLPWHGRTLIGFVNCPCRRSRKNVACCAGQEQGRGRGCMAGSWRRSLAKRLINLTGFPLPLSLSSQCPLRRQSRRNAMCLAPHRFISPGHRRILTDKMAKSRATKCFTYRSMSFTVSPYPYPISQVFSGLSAWLANYFSGIEYCHLSAYLYVCVFACMRIGFGISAQLCNAINPLTC